MMDTVKKTFVQNVAIPSLTVGGKASPVKLPRAHLIRRIGLRYKLQYDSTSANAETWEGILAGLTDIEVKGNGGTIKKGRASDFYYKNQFIYGKAGEKTTLETGTTSNSTGYFTIFLDFFSRKRQDVKDMLVAKLYSTLELNLTFGTPANQADNITFDSASVDVIVEEVLDEGQYTREEIAQFHVVKEVIHTITGITGAGRKTLELPLGNKIRNMMILAKDGSTVALDNSLIDNIDIVEDDTVDHMSEVPFASLQAEDIMEYRMVQSTSALLAGRTIIECDDNPEKEPLQTQGMASFKLKPEIASGQPDSSANAEIRVLLEESVERKSQAV